MASERRPLRPDKPIRRCTVIGEARVSTVETVFCPERAASIGMKECEGCARYVGRALDVDGSAVVCAGSTASAGSAVGGAAIVARMLAPETICVREDVGVARVRALLRAPGASIPVVGADGVLLGVVDAHALAAHASDFPPPRFAHELMSSRQVAIGEETSVLAAAVFMAAKHLRSTVVVDSRGHAVGVLDDLALLRWIAEHPCLR